MQSTTSNLLSSMTDGFLHVIFRRRRSFLSSTYFLISDIYRVKETQVYTCYERLRKLYPLLLISISFPPVRGSGICGYNGGEGVFKENVDVACQVSGE